MNKYSLNNRLVVETYQKESLKSTVSNGFAKIAQKVGVKGLTVLMDAKLNDGTVIPAGSTAYVREELLHTQTWAQKHLSCDTMTDPFLIIDMAHVDFVSPPKDPAA